MRRDIQRVKARKAAKHSTMYRAALVLKNCWAQNSVIPKYQWSPGLNKSSPLTVSVILGKSLKLINITSLLKYVPEVMENILSE